MEYLKRGYTNNHIQFKCSNRIVYCYGSVVGIGPDGIARYGWDGDIDEDVGGPITPDERAELAQHMIELWTKFLNEATN